MGSTAIDSGDELHKMFVYGDPVVGITCAGNVGMAAEMVPIFTQNLSVLPRRTHGTIWEALSASVHAHRVQHFHWDVAVPKYSFDQDGKIPSVFIEHLQKEFADYDTGSQVLVGALDDAGMALLYLVGPDYDDSGRKPGWVHLREYPGHWSIGIGAPHADFWLNYRGQHLGLSVRQSAYHAYEAKIMAARAPAVNQSVEMIVAVRGKTYHLTKGKPSAEGCPVSLTELAEMFLKYGPQDTHGLGNQPSSAITS